MDRGQPIAAPRQLKPPKLGGLNHLERLLGLRQDAVLSTDAVFLSLDLEVASDRQKLHLSAEKPIIKQLGIAKMDTRAIHSFSLSGDLKALISVHMFEDREAPNSKKVIRSKEDGRQCVFAQTQQITQEEILVTVSQFLHIADDRHNSGNGCPRDIVLVGHSLREDLKILSCLGIDILSMASILTTIDTHTISRFVLPPYHPNIIPEPNQDFSLRGVLSEFGYCPHPHQFHNAGNDAAYTLYAMLSLANKRGTTRMAELKRDELKNLQTIGQIISCLTNACSGNPPEN